MFKTDAVVIGAGVVGLAIARALALKGREVIVLEAEPLIGSITSARNSEVIHAGLYYPTGSLKARLCVEGRAALYAYCESRGVPHRRCGKLVVGIDMAEEAYLQKLEATARANGAGEVALITGQAAQEMEPQIRAVCALHSPATGIIDSHALMLSYRGEIEAHGGAVALSSPVVAGEIGRDGIRIETGGPDAATLMADLVVNSAGLSAWDVSHRLGLPAEKIPPRHIAKGNYFALSGRAPATRLIYPVPEPGGLGVHLTLDLAGQARFGPDVEWVSEIGYEVDPRRGDAFYAAIRRYWPGLKDGALQPAYSGIRPKITGPGEAAGDFLIEAPAPGYIALYGIESPGLTASLAIGDHVAGMA